MTGEFQLNFHLFNINIAHYYIRVFDQNDHSKIAVCEFRFSNNYLPLAVFRVVRCISFHREKTILLFLIR